MPTLSIAEMANLFGTAQDRLGARIKARIEACDWNYEPLVGEERDAVIMDLLARIENRKLTTVANEDKSRWVKGWGENLKALHDNMGDLDALVPKYIRAGQVVRLKGDLVRSHDPNFELNWFRIFSEWFFSTRLSNYDEIFEFGSGS